jgi:predicted peptidase
MAFPGCDTDAGNGLNPNNYIPIVETFDAADRPAFELVTLDIGGSEKTYKLQKPWNYDKPHNAGREYPLIVSLHGSGGSYYAPCIVGDDEEMQRYPCFFMAPTNGDWGGGAAWVRTEIETLKSTYRIDENRLYLMGFSMGGSGSYSFAGGYYTEQGGFFAGIVRLAGQSQTTLPDPLVEKTSVWYQIGLNDTSNNRVGIARDAYAYYKNHSANGDARETLTTDTVLSGSTEYPRSTKTLTLNGVEIFKLSEYEGMGHDGSLPFRDPGILQWLFSQSL